MSKIFFFIVFLLLAAGCAQVEEPITSFEECIAAGNPAMESYPRQCRANGQTFTEVVTAPDEPDEPIVGGDKDEHGCIGSAGYQWCEMTQLCQRFWEEPCPDNLPDLYPGNCYEMEATPVKLSEGCAEGEEMIANVMGFKVPYVCCIEEGLVQKTYCTPESREGDMCIAVYEPVCGWFANGQGTDTYSNSCHTCLDDKVEYWTEGEC